jgi:hypothetical protein
MQGKSDREIVKETNICKTTVNRIRKQETSHRMHRTRPNYPRMITTREIRQALRFIATSYPTRCLTLKRTKALDPCRATSLKTYNLGFRIVDLGF